MLKLFVLDDFPTFSFVPLVFPVSKQILYCRIQSWIGEKERQVETWKTPSGILLKVSGGSDFHISSDGSSITCIDNSKESDKQSPPLLN